MINKVTLKCACGCEQSLENELDATLAGEAADEMKRVSLAFALSCYGWARIASCYGKISWLCPYCSEDRKENER